MINYRNEVTLIGDVGQTVTNFKGDITMFSVKTCISNGDLTETTWHDIRVFCDCPKDLKRGDVVHINGSLAHYYYTNASNGETTASTVIKANNIRLVNN